MRVGIGWAPGEGARQVFDTLHPAEVEAGRHAVAKVPARARVEPVALLLRVVAISFEAHGGKAAVDVEGAAYPDGVDVLLGEYEGARLAPGLDGNGVVSRVGVGVDGGYAGV